MYIYFIIKKIGIIKLIGVIN